MVGRCVVFKVTLDDDDTAVTGVTVNDPLVEMQDTF